jgi:putative peptidoglycan lipid II flippase
MKHFARSSLIIAFFFAIDKVLAFIRQTILARQFGLSYELDVFNAANNIPDLLSALISGGALGVALIPVLSEYLETRGRSQAWRLFSRVVNLAFIVTAVIAAIFAILAPAIINNLIAPGFPEEQKMLAAEIMRLDLIAILIFSISGLVMAGLQANQHFLLPAIAPGLYNLGQIFGAAILSPTSGMQLGPLSLPGLGMGIHGLVYGVIIGSLLHLLIQVPGLIRYGFRWTPEVKLRAPGMGKVLSLLGPRVLTKFFIFMFFIVRDNLASGMGEGAVTALNMGWFIMQVPETLIGTTIAIALLPTISELFARDDKSAFVHTMNGAYRVMLALTIPAAALLAAGLEPLVSSAFGYTPEETTFVVLATRIYLLGLVGHALLEITVRAFYAQQNANIPLAAAAFNASLYIGIAFLLAKQIGFAGVALANSIAFSVETLLLMWLLHLNYKGVLKVGGTFLRVLLISGIVAGGLFLFLQLPSIQNFSPFGYAVCSAGGMLIGLVIILPFILPEIKLLFALGERE